MDINSTTITVSSIFLLIGIILSISSFINNNKKDIQVKASDYAVYKSKVENLELTVHELKEDVKSQHKELKDDMKRLDEQLIKKVDNLYNMVGELKDLIIAKL